LDKTTETELICHTPLVWKGKSDFRILDDWNRGHVSLKDSIDQARLTKQRRTTGRLYLITDGNYPQNSATEYGLQKNQGQ